MSESISYLKHEVPAEYVTKWQKTIDGHFRRYSVLKHYVETNSIQCYQTTTLKIIGRVNELERTTQ